MRLSNKNGDRVKLHEQAFLLKFYCVKWFWREISRVDLELAEWFVIDK